MNNPEKTPPVAISTNGNSSNAPSIEVPSLSSSLVQEANAPTLTPPERSEAAGAIGAAVWSTDKRVNGIYTTFNPRNAWMSIAGVGWKKLATGSDAMCEAMTQLAAHAREKNCRIDYAEENGLVTQIYVW